MRKPILYLGVIIIFSFALALWYCYYRFPFWTYRNTDNCKALVEVDLSNMRGYRGKQILVHRDFYPSLKEMNRLAEVRDITIILNQGYRHPKQKVKGAIVGPATFSNHQAGFAIDCNLKWKGEIYTSKHLSKMKFALLPHSVSEFITETKTRIGMRWGGDFQPEDPVHFDLPVNLENRSEWKSAQQECKEDFENCPLIWQFWK